MKKAVIYARVSSDMQQKERTIESQIAELKRQIIQAGDKLVKEYIDDGHSGADLDRPALNRLRNDLKEKVFDAVYFLNTDRIARDVTYQNIIIGEMLRYKKQIIINGVDYIHNPENKFNLTVLGAVAELERAKLIERVQRGRQHRLNQGRLLGCGSQTYGYDYHRKTATSFPSYTVSEEEAKFVRYAYEKYEAGDTSTTRLAEDLEKMKAPRKTQSAHWHASHVKSILQNEMYTGTRYFNTMKFTKVAREPGQAGPKEVKEITDRSTWIGIEVPQIISKELFDRVQARLAFNAKCIRNAIGKQLFSNLLFCGECGMRCYCFRKSYIVERKDGPRVYQKVSFRCNNSKICRSSDMDLRLVEEYVNEMVQDTLFDPEKTRSCMEVFDKKKENGRVKIKREMKRLDKKLEKIHQQKMRVVDLYASGNLDRDEYADRIHFYESQAMTFKVERGELEKRTSSRYQPEKVKESIRKFCREAEYQYEHSADFATKRRFFLDNTKRVVYLRKNENTDMIAVKGFIPIYEEDGHSSGNLEYSIEKKFDRKDIREKLKKVNEEKGTVGGRQIFNMQYGELVTKNENL